MSFRLGNGFRLKGSKRASACGWSLSRLAGATILLVFVAFILPRSSQGDFNAPKRYSLFKVQYTIYEWWLSSWSENELVCQIFIEHEGWPTGEDVIWSCGPDIFETWSETKTCLAAEEEGDLTTCDGLYLSLLATTRAEREIWVDLPSPTMWISVQGCSPSPPENRCDEIPNLQLRGVEPLPNEAITRIVGSLNKLSFSCEGSICEVPLEPTEPSGVWAYFQADSTVGDSSPIYNAQIRVMRAPGTTTQDPDWYVDVISTQWRGKPLASCSQVWQTFPPPGGPPPWLSTPENAQDLNTEEPYVYLAGVLITVGEVDASECPNGGLLPNGHANTCGLEKAYDKATEWQNQFDQIILEVANSSSVPAQLMKNLFARESQFWPGIFKSAGEAGLGQFTENGADTTLLWNQSFYEQFCPLVLDEDACLEGYPHLAEEDQAMLRGALYNQVNAQCEECPLGIDLTQADYSVEVFAETLLANCTQVGQMIWNTTVDAPTSSYEDLWRFTILNYNAGPGCLAQAIDDTWSNDLPLNWTNVSLALGPVCSGGIGYVNDIAQ